MFKSKKVKKLEKELREAQERLDKALRKDMIEHLETKKHNEKLRKEHGGNGMRECFSGEG